MNDEQDLLLDTLQVKLHKYWLQLAKENNLNLDRLDLCLDIEDVNEDLPFYS